MGIRLGADGISDTTREFISDGRVQEAGEDSVSSRILVADPSAFCREILITALEGRGFSVSACTPQELSQALSKVNPDLLLLESGAIDGLGLSILETVRRDARWSTLPVVTLTEFADKASVMKAATLGVRDFILKQRFTTAELLTRIRKYVASDKAASAPLSGNDPAAGAKAATPVYNPSSTPQQDAEIVEEAARQAGIALLSKAQMLHRLQKVQIKTLPGSVAELISLAGSRRGTVADVAQILKRDPVLLTRVLRVSNSAAFSSERSRIMNIEDAVKNIGLRGVQNLVMGVGVFEAFDNDNPAQAQSIVRCWQHCLGVAILMEKMVPEGDEAPAGAPYIVGLCHDLIDIILRQHFAPEYANVMTLAHQTGVPQRQVEGVIYGLPYNELVTLLLSRVGLPPLITAPIQEFFERAVHKQAVGTGSVMGRALRIANVYAHGLMLAPSAGEPVVPLGRMECKTTFGEALPIIDDLEVRSQAMATVAELLGASSSSARKMIEPFVPTGSHRLCYVRNEDCTDLDPLLSLLRLACKQVDFWSTLPSKPEELAQVDALVIAARRGVDPGEIQQELDRLERLLEPLGVPALYLGGMGPDKLQRVPRGITVERLPTTIQRLGAFLESCKGLKAAA